MRALVLVLDKFIPTIGIYMRPESRMETEWGTTMLGGCVRVCGAPLALPSYLAWAKGRNYDSRRVRAGCSVLMRFTSWIPAVSYRRGHQGNRRWRGGLAPPP